MKKRMNKLVAVTLAVVTLFSSALTAKASGSPYADVYESDWYYDSIVYARNRGYMTGVDTNHFDPGSYLQRQDLAVILMRYHEQTEGPINDIPDDGTYYGKAVAWVKSEGIMKGYENGDFGVGDVITRQDMVLTFRRYMRKHGLMEIDSFEDPYYKEKMEKFISMFGDMDQLRKNCFDDMYRAVMLYKVIEGVERDGKKYLDPNGYTTRGTASVFLKRSIMLFESL